MASFPGGRAGGAPALGNLVQSVAAAASGSTSINVSWTATVPAPLFYRVYRNGSLVGSAATTSFADTGLSPSTTYAYQISAVNAVGEGARNSPAANATTSSSGGTAKNWNSGWYMGSNNTNGTGSNNQNEMNHIASARSAGANVLGWIAIYQWPAFEPTLGGYLFANIQTDFQYLQSVVPGAHFGLIFEPAHYSGTGPNSAGTPTYILNGSTYGPGYDGVHEGYWAFNFTGGSPPPQQGGVAALWRTAVMARYTALLQALAATPTDPVNRPGMTFGNDPLVEFIADQETSLSLISGSDYSDGAFIPAMNNLHAVMAGAFTQAQIAPQLNFCQNTANMASLVNAAFSLGIAMSGPDVFASAPAHLTAGQQVYVGNVWNGSTWVAGGTDRRGTMPLIGQVQQSTTTSDGATPANLLSSFQYLQATHRVFVYLVGGAFDWSSVMVPFIAANPFSAPYPTGYYP